MNEQADRQMNEQTVAGDLDMRSRWESDHSQGMMQTACPEEREECIVGPCDDSCSISICCHLVFILSSIEVPLVNSEVRLPPSYCVNY